MEVGKQGKLEGKWERWVGRLDEGKAKWKETEVKDEGKNRESCLAMPGSVPL